MKLFSRSKKSGSWGSPAAYVKKKAHPIGISGFSEPETGSNHPGNLIFGRNTRLSINTPETFIYPNTIVLGGTGSGKTFRFAIPNVLQGRTSYIIMDYDGSIIKNTYASLLKLGYDIKVLNLKDTLHSCMYNPFWYIQKEEDAVLMASCMVKSHQNADPFFVNAETTLLTFIIMYIRWTQTKEHQTLDRIIEILTRVTASDSAEQSGAITPIDALYNDCKRKHPDSAALKYYEQFLLMPEKTRKAIIMSLFIDLSPYTASDIKKLTSGDTLYLNELGDHKQAVFIEVPFNLRTYDKLVTLAMTQAINIMYSKCSNENEAVGGIEWNGAYHVTTKPFNPAGRMAHTVRMEIDARVEHYRTAIVCESGDPLRPFCCKTINGDIIPWGTYPDLRPALFATKEQADYFLRGIKEGHLTVHKNRLCSPVNIIYDGNLAETCIIPDFKDILKVSPKFNIFFTIMAQSLHHLSTIFDGDIDTAIENCGTLLFYGTNSLETAEFISRRLGCGPDHTPLMTTDEVLRYTSKEPRECLILTSGMPPISDKAYAATEHPNWIHDPFDDDVDLIKHFETGK